MNHDGASCGLLWQSYEIVLQTQKSIQEKRLVEDQIAVKKLVRLEEPCQRLTNRSANSLLSDPDDPTKDIQSLASQAAAVSRLVKGSGWQQPSPSQQLGATPYISTDFATLSNILHINNCSGQPTKTISEPECR